ncbi:hypothetical protein [Heyndrickxia ginsengihumi]|uniref:hypothetical protein n=1 Tax=Heyndrickxia ginsengihumi TaxID=363870 RepID=UPI002041DF30|nr:hypothetical protein [Heyndrickxia ginsengihumi]MCM3022329.1 hypothetical protein [Heyndrickxia ginsengihumi]
MIGKLIIYGLIDNQYSNLEDILSLYEKVTDYCKKERIEVINTIFLEDDIDNPIGESTIDLFGKIYALQEGAKIILIHDKSQYPEIHLIDLGSKEDYEGFDEIVSLLS